MNRTSKCLFIPTERRPPKNGGSVTATSTCALCDRERHSQGLCKRHSRKLDKQVSSFASAGLRLAEFLAKPGVEPLEYVDIDPYYNRATSFLTEAARHYNSDVKEYLQSL